jgi:hypothetical protein
MHFRKACSNEANMLVQHCCWIQHVWTLCWMMLDNVGLSLSLPKIISLYQMPIPDASFREFDERGLATANGIVVMNSCIVFTV